MKSYREFSKDVDNLSSTILDCYDEVLTELKEANDRIEELEKDKSALEEENKGMKSDIEYLEKQLREVTEEYEKWLSATENRGLSSAMVSGIV
jgi:predicted nuclease with TOPRIM domain